MTPARKIARVVLAIVVAWAAAETLGGNPGAVLILGIAALMFRA